MQQIAAALDYADVLQEYPAIIGFLSEKFIINIERLKSIWRKENILLKLQCDDGCYVFKKINDKGKETETHRVKLLKQEYPHLLPKTYCFEKNAYLMKYIEGKGFFELDEDDKVDKMNLAGRIIAEAYSCRSAQEQDISIQIQGSFEKYRKKSERFFKKDELTSYDFKLFKSVPDIPSHGDLNAANLLYDESIKMIDPSDEGYNDIARDIGRYCASCFFNNYDRFGNNKRHSVEIAEAFLCNFNDEILERARYYIGESFMSFLNFQTISVPKTALKNLAVRMLRNKNIMENLKEGL